jgi:protein-L-isoaspartate(D-aspartate) O-methyltransferase
VIVTAAAPRVPAALRAQLHDRGRIVIPVGSAELQHLEVWTHTAGGGWEGRRFGECRFVPLLGHDAWRDES